MYPSLQDSGKYPVSKILLNNTSKKGDNESIPVAKNSFRNLSGPPLRPFFSCFIARFISSYVIGPFNSSNMIWISEFKKRSLKYRISSSGWKKESLGLFIDLI